MSEVFPPPTKSLNRKAATIPDFMILVNKVLTAAWGERWGTLVRGYPKQSEARDVPAPMISWHVISERPSTDHRYTELKPRIREVIDDTLDGNNKYLMWGHKLEVELEFNIYAYTDTEADVLVERFKDAMTIYTGIFKQEGMQEFVYLGQDADRLFGDKQIAQELAIRPVRYMVRIERLTLESTGVIESIILKVGLMRADGEQPTETVTTTITGAVNPVLLANDSDK